MLSDSPYRLMSFDGLIHNTSAWLSHHIVPATLTDLNFKQAQSSNEYYAIVSGSALGFAVWLVLFVLHRIQIFVIDFAAFLPLKK